MTARGNEEKSGDEGEDERVEGQGSPLRAGSDDFISSPSAILLINTVPPSRVVCTRGRGSSNSTEPENDRGDFHISDTHFPAFDKCNPTVYRTSRASRYFGGRFESLARACMSSSRTAASTAGGVDQAEQSMSRFQTMKCRVCMSTRPRTLCAA